MIDGWYPRINSLGEVCSGTKSIYFGDKQLTIPGIYPGWYDDNLIIFIGENDYLFVIGKDGNNFRQLSTVKYSRIFANNQSIIGLGIPNIYINLKIIERGKAPSISRNGLNITYVRPFYEDNTDVICNGKIIGSGLIYNTSTSNLAVCWSYKDGSKRLVAGVRSLNSHVEQLYLTDWEEPILVDVEGVPWICSRLHDDTLNVHPWGSKFGYHFDISCWNPDALFINGKLLVAYSDGAGDPARLEIDLNTPRVDLTLRNGAPPAPPIPPEKPVPPKEPKPMDRPPFKIETVKRMLRLHPEVDIVNEDTRGKILDYFCNAENPSGKKEPWGRKARNKDGSNKNTDGITYLLADNRFFIIDAIAGIDPLEPGEELNPDRSVYATWEVYGPFAQGENGYWAPAEPVNSTPVPPEKPVPPSEPVPPTKPVDPPKEKPVKTIDEMMALVDKMNAANKTTKFAKDIPIVAARDLYPIRTTAHILYGWFFEGKTDEQVIQEVIERGNA